MKVHYNQKDDVLMLELGKKKVDHAFEMKAGLVHVSANNEPVLIEIFNAHKFFAAEGKTLPEEIKSRYFA